MQIIQIEVQCMLCESFVKISVDVDDLDHEEMQTSVCPQCELTEYESFQEEIEENIHNAYLKMIKRRENGSTD